MSGRRARSWGILVLILGVAGGTAVTWRLWRQQQGAESLFRRFPADNLLLIYLDVGGLRRAGSLAPLLRARVDPDPDYASFVRQTGFDYQRDLDAAAVCYLADRVYLLARGRFDPARLRQYALSQGGSCGGGELEKPCRMPASRPDRTISFWLLTGGLLALATAPEAEAALQLGSPPAENAGPIARAAAAPDSRSPLLWMTAAPASLDLLGASATSPHLALLARALSGAERAYLFVSDRSPDLAVSLTATCRSASQAGEIRQLLQGLNDLAAGLSRLAPGSKPGGAWPQVLASAVIRHEQGSVRAHWTVPPPALEALAAP